MARRQSRGQLASSRREFRFGKDGFQRPICYRAQERFVLIGMAEGHVVLYVAYTEREERIRIISARGATQHEQDDYFRQNA